MPGEAGSKGDGNRSATLILRQLIFDPAARLVVVSGQETLLDPRSSIVLATLIDQFGRRIDKDELLRAAWPNQLVHENSLAKAISKLRRAIRGSGVEIAVSYGTGYTLRDIPVRGAGATTVHSDGVSQAVVTGRGRLKEWKSAAAATLGILILVAAGIFAFVRSDRASAIRQAHPITNDASDVIATILWVDDHPSNNLPEIAFFKQRRIAVHIAESTPDALNLMAMNNYQLVLSDLGRGDDRLAGLRMVGAMKQRRVAVPVIIYTVRPKHRTGQQAQIRLVAAAGASGLAVTPHEVRAKAIEMLAPAT